MSMPTATRVRPIMHKGLQGSDCHILTFDEDEQGRPGMIGVLMPGVHCIGTAQCDMEVHAILGIIHEYNGDRMIDAGGRFSLKFKKDQVMHLRVAEPADDNLNGHYPVIFRAYPVRGAGAPERK